MNAIIIAGGSSTRIRPLSNEIPKTMIEIYGKSILERQIELFQRYGISDITVVTGYQSEKINLPNITCIKNEKYKSTNVNEGLFCAKAKFNDSVVITHGDLIFEHEVLEQALNFKKNDLLLAESIGMFKLSKSGAGILLDRYNHLKKSHKGRFHSSPSFKDAFFFDMIQDIIDTNVIVEPIPINGGWCEIDRQIDLERAKEIFSHQSK